MLPPVLSKRCLAILSRKYTIILCLFVSSLPARFAPCPPKGVLSTMEDLLPVSGITSFIQSALPCIEFFELLFNKSYNDISPFDSPYFL